MGIFGIAKHVVGVSATAGVMRACNQPKTRPWICTKVLNQEECGVKAVGRTLCTCELVYKEPHAMNPCKDIDHVIFIRSSVRREYEEFARVEADFDIYTKDGRVIEVWSCDRNVLQAAMKLTRVPDAREKYRKARGR